MFNFGNDVDGRQIGDKSTTKSKVDFRLCHQCVPALSAITVKMLMTLDGPAVIDAKAR